MPTDAHSLLAARSHATHGSPTAAEAQSLLADTDITPPSDELDTPPPPPTANGYAVAPTHPSPSPLPSHRRLPLPSLIRPTDPSTPRTPRTANRVRWASEERPRRPNSRGGMGFYPDAEGASSWEREGVADWEDFDEEAYARREAERREEEREYEEARREGAGSAAQRTPLLADIEAPSVTEALREEGEEVEIGAGEGEGEGGRPKSGMRSAFMNMANSIMYV